MRMRLRWHWHIWSLIPSVGVRTRAHSVVFEWLCASLWLEDTSVSRSWIGSHLQVSIGHSATSLSLPTVRIRFSKDEMNIYVSVLGFWLSLNVTVEDNSDLPF